MQYMKNIFTLFILTNSLYCFAQKQFTGIGFLQINKTTLMQVENFAAKEKEGAYILEYDYDKRFYQPFLIAPQSLSFKILSSPTIDRVKFSNIYLEFYQDTLIALSAPISEELYEAILKNYGAGTMKTMGANHQRVTTHMLISGQYCAILTQNYHLYTLALRDKSRDDFLQKKYIQEQKEKRSKNEEVYLTALNDKNVIPIKQFDPHFGINDSEYKNTETIFINYPISIDIASYYLKLDTTCIRHLNPQLAEYIDNGNFKINYHFRMPAGTLKKHPHDFTIIEDYSKRNYLNK